MRINLLLIAAIIMAHSVTAQSFFKPLPKREQIVVINQNMLAPNGEVTGRFKSLAIVNTSMDSTMNAWRPIANIAAYAEPGNILMAGAGISYQHLKWDITNQKWNCQWSISALGWAGGSVAPKTPADAISYGIMFGVLNNLIMIGPAINGNKVIATIAVGISLNN